MRDHFGVGSGVVAEQAEGVGQKQIVQLVLDPTEHTPIETFPVKRKVDVGTWPGRSLGPGPEKNGSCHFGKMGQRSLDLLHGLWRQAVPVHDPASCSREKRVENCENCAQ
jgi:hypothetical protein